MTRVTIGWVAATAAVLLLASCGGGSTATPPPGGNNFLAGGGRSGSTDEFTGGPDGSGPSSPQDGNSGGDTPTNAPEPYKGFIPIFYADSNCFPAPFETVLTSQADFQTWWTTAVDCQPHYGTGVDQAPEYDPNPGDGSGGSDGGWIEPGEPYDPYGETAPEVDFSTYVVVAIGLDAEASLGRSVFVQDTVPTTGGGTTINYEISSPGADCVEFFAPLEPSFTSSPTIAVLVPKPVDAPYTFTHTETTWNCTWEPDPAQPLTLYYTDASCDLGPSHSVITSEAVWLAWLDAAFDCEIARWDDPYGYPVGVGREDTPNSGGGGSSSPGDPGQPPSPGPDGGFGGGENPVDNGTDPTPPPPSSWGIDVDFSTHAIILLRSDAQNQWGGGIWLNSVTTSATGTVIEYTELDPSGDCPDSESDDPLRPTVAIRVPLPLTGPISYIKHVEEINCDWGNGVEPQPGDGTPPPEPRPL